MSGWRMDLSPEIPLNAVLFFRPEAADAGWPGALAPAGACRSFVDAYVRHSGAAAFHVHCARKGHFDRFRRRAAALDDKATPCRWIGLADQDGLAEVGCLWLPGPDLDGAAWQRRAVGPSLYSLCGVVHAMADGTVMDRLGALLTSPVQPWDAVVCTSQALRAAVCRLLANWAEFLDQRTGGRGRIGVQLPVIPPGVDCDAYAGDDARRAAFRERFGIEAEAFAVLAAGRARPRASDDPSPMLLALEAAAGRTAVPLHLIWLDASGDGARGGGAGHPACPSVRVHAVDGADDAARAGAWAAADAFVSLEDGIDGVPPISPAEAMAAGLPSVAADWGASRDWLRPGVDGFLIPTWMPPAGAGRGLELPVAGSLGGAERAQAQAQALYRGYVGGVTAVDLAAAAEALAALAGDAGLRRRIGAAARRRARECCDWRVVIASYQALWDELAALRGSATEIAAKPAGRPIHPLRDDPFALFAAYATPRPARTCTVAPGPAAETSASWPLAEPPAATGGAAAVMASEAEVDAMLARLADGATPLEAVVDGLPAERRGAALRGLGRLGRMGWVRIGAEADGADDEAPVLGERPSPDEMAAAEAYWRERLDADGDDPRALLGLAAVARARDDGAGAVSLLKQALVRRPDDGEVLLALGQAHGGTGDWDAAVISFRQAVRLAPGWVAARLGLARALFGGGQAGPAAAELRRALRLAPKDARLWFWLGIVLHHLGELDEALDCFDQAREEGGETADLLYHVGLIHESWGDIEAARLAFAEALRLKSESAEARWAAMMADDETA